MALLNMQFNQAEMKEALEDRYELLPAGTYIAEITRSEIKDNNSGSGNRLSLGFKILDGQYAGRLVFQDITLRNANDIAQQIGRKQMAQLLHACGKTGVQDSGELHGIPIQIKVAIRKDKTGLYDDQNEIKKFAPLANQPTFNSQSPVTNNSPQPQDNRPVWARG